MPWGYTQHSPHVHCLHRSLASHAGKVRCHHTITLKRHTYVLLLKQFKSFRKLLEVCDGGGAVGGGGEDELFDIDREALFFGN
jgi:hypothetical protein